MVSVTNPLMTSYDVTSNICRPISRHVIETHLNPRPLS
jgi:hypothetical protein